MKIKTKEFRVSGGKKVRLAKHPTKTAPFYKSDKHYRKLMDADREELRDLQRRLYAANSHAVLLIFQAMDAAGKDGAINHVMRGVNPQGCEVYSFKHPSAEELDHDFLWRTTCRLPARGRIGVFNRSYYEEVLIVRVHPEILVSERVPDQGGDQQSVWKGRYRSIVDFEAHLQRNGTRVIKFFLHLSKAEQRRRFWPGSMKRTRTGNSARRTSRNADFGSNTNGHMRIASARRARKRRRGMWCRRMTNTMRA
jgi:PPK2 family polyphosphate:nucleotide phosphotransferase